MQPDRAKLASTSRSGTPLALVLASATRAVQAVLAGGRSLEAALAAERTLESDARARSSLRDYATGTLREWRTLQTLAHWSAGRTTFAPQVLEMLLAVALYGLRNTRVPAHTLVSEAVQASVALAGAQAKGFVNAVLRNFQRRAAQWTARLQHEPMAVQLSYPDWWVARIERDWPQAAGAILQAGNTKPPMAVRVNPKRITRDAWVAQAQAEGIHARPFGAYGALLAHPVPTAQLPGFVAGQVSVQDAGAQIVADAIALRDGQRVLDACCAPGGKSAALLQRAEIALTALDVDRERQTTTHELLRRLGLTADVRTGDAGEPEAWWDGTPFDVIVLDAPCTASGVVRRHPDSKWLKRASDVRALADQQARLLNALWPTLARGGTLYYITCSVFRDENSHQVERFLQQHTDARREPVVWPVGVIAHEGAQLLPGGASSTHNHDGFFCAALTKISL